MTQNKGQPCKRMRKAIPLALCASLLLSSQAFAAAEDTHEYGVTDKSTNAGYTLTMQTDENATATSYTGVTSDGTKTVYDGVAKMTLDFAGTEDEQYMVFLLQGDGEETIVPTASNLQYIDQITATGVDSFTIYPSALETGDYTIYVSSTNSEYAEVGSFSVVSEWEEAAFMLGDVNNNGEPDANDAVMVLQKVATQITLNETQTSAANVLNPTTTDVDANDAVRILQYVARQITEF